MRGALCVSTLVCRKDTMRAGQQAYACPGLGTWVFAPKQDIQLVVIKAEKIADAMTFNIEHMDKLFQDKKIGRMSWPQILLPQGGIAWVPHGHIVYYTGRKELNSFTMISWANKVLIGEAMDSVMESTFKATRKHAGENSSKPFSKIL